jgi:hypothetical protein
MEGLRGEDEGGSVTTGRSRIPLTAEEQGVLRASTILGFLVLFLPILLYVTLGLLGLLPG